MPAYRKLLTSLLLSVPLFAASAAHAEDKATQKPSQTSDKNTSQFVYKFLIGEIAGQRGEYSLASTMYLDLAKSTRDPRLAERATRIALFANQPYFALRASTVWAELDPESTSATQTVAQLLIDASRVSEAKPHLQKLLATPQTRANGFLYLNELLSRSKQRSAALKLVQELASPYPDLPEAHFSVAHTAWAGGKDKIALEELRIADELRPGWELSALLHGQILLGQSTSAAASYYKEFLDKHPEARDVRLNYARLLANDRHFESAREQFTKLTESAAGNPEIFVVVGLLSIQQGDFSEGEQYLQQAINLGFKDKNQIYLYLGQAAEGRGRHDEALDWYKRVERGGDHYLDAQLRVAGVLAQQNQLDQARTLLHGLTMDVTDDQQQVTILQTEANLLIQAKRYQEAFDLLGQAVTNQPNTPELIYDYAMVAERVQHFDVMEHELRKLILLKPEYAQAYNALGYTLADRNERLPEASKLIEKALALSPNDHFILDSMGWVQYRLGRLDKALDFLKRAYTTQTDPEIAAHLGEVLWQKGNHADALKTWEEALREHPDNEVLLNTTKKFQQ